MKIRAGIALQAALYIGAGIMHFLQPQSYLRIMPAWVPWPEAAVLWSGVAEVVLGAGLLFGKTRQAAALGIIALLIAVFPANVEMARDWWNEDRNGRWLAILRLPLQAALVWWAWKVRKQ